MAEKEKIITIESVDDDESYGKEYKKVMDTHGLYYNVKQGREGCLKAKWNLLKIGTRIKIIFGEYKGKKFVQDIELVAEASEGTIPLESPNLLSKEFNTLIMAAKDAWIASKLTSDDPEIKALRKLMCFRFASPEIGQPNPSPQKGEAQASQKPIETEVVKAEGRDPHSLQNLGELFMAIYKDFKITKTQALKAWGYDSQEKIKDIPGCYQFIASMEEARREE